VNFEVTMDDESNGCLCSLEHVLDTIGRKWALMIIDEIGRNEKRRFNDLQSTLDGVSPSTLATMLRKLEKIDLVERKAFNEIPPRVEYSLSKNGKDFQKLLEPLNDWATKNERNDDNCKCNQIKQDHLHIDKTPKENLKRLIEASLCACYCFPLMSGIFLLIFRI